MLSTGLKIGRGNRGGEDRFYNPAKARRQRESLRRAQSDVTPPYRRTEKQPGSCEALKEAAEPAAQEPVVPPLSNLERFLESVTPSVPAQYLPKTTMRGCRTSGEKSRPFFVLEDLWESFKEWSAYGAGVPLILNESDYVVQYYVSYLSGIQIYVNNKKSLVKPRANIACALVNANCKLHVLQEIDPLFIRWFFSIPLMGLDEFQEIKRPGDESDSDFRDSNSEGSNVDEHGNGRRFLGEQQNQCSLSSGVASLRLEDLSMRDQHSALPEDISSDEGESLGSEGHLLFEYFEWNPPFSREPLADKISDLAHSLPELRTLRSCDLLHSSWVSVAWYPIYRIPTGPTLKDLDACFLTYHSLHTPMEGTGGEQAVVMSSSNYMDGIPKMPLRAFGLASYKLKKSLWTSIGPDDRSHVANLFHEAADDWLRSHHISHPDFQFFCRR